VNREGASSPAPGLRRVWRAALARIRSKPIVLQRRRIYAFDLGEPVPTVESRLALRFETEPDFEGEGDPPELVFRALTGSDVVYQMRIALRRDDFIRLLRGCSVPPRPIFLYDCYTHASYRGQGAYPASLTHALRLARERGYDGAYIRVERRNVASARGIERAGFRPAAVIVHAALFGIPIGPFGRPAQWAATPEPQGEGQRR